MQCQLFCTQRTYCDFVVWTKKDVHIERIYPDNVFWLNHIQQVDHFFQVGILPELVGNFIPDRQPWIHLHQYPHHLKLQVKLLVKKLRQLTNIVIAMRTKKTK